MGQKSFLLLNKPMGATVIVGLSLDSHRYDGAYVTPK